MAALYCLSRVAGVGMFQPKGLDGLVGENVVPMIRLRSADVLQPALAIVGIVGDHGFRRIGGGFFSAHGDVLMQIPAFERAATTWA